MEFDYYHLYLTTGKEILKLRERIQEDDRYPNPKFYDIEIQPDKYYMISVIDEDISALTAIYIEEIIYEKEI